jgi:hypothetical protein
MLFRRNKIKENKSKPGLYGNRYNQKNDFSAWDSMSFIEQICLIVLPIMLCSLFYVMLEVTGLIWWIRVPIAIGITSILSVLIYWWSSWMSEQDWI